MQYDLRSIYNYAHYDYRRILEKHVRNISNFSLQMKYCHNISVNYCKIFHRNITILTFWNIFENK